MRDNETYWYFHWCMKTRLNTISKKTFNITHRFLFIISLIKSTYWCWYCHCLLPVKFSSFLKTQHFALPVWILLYRVLYVSCTRIHSTLMWSTKQVNRQVVAQTFETKFSDTYFEIYSKFFNFPVSPTTHRYLLSNIHILAIQPTFSHSNIHHSMVHLNGVKCQSIICNLSTPHTNQLQYLKSNEILYKIAFTYVTFADIWIGQHYVIATNYDVTSFRNSACPSTIDVSPGHVNILRVWQSELYQAIRISPKSKYYIRDSCTSIRPYISNTSATTGRI